LKPWARIKYWAIYLLNKSSANATSLAGDIAEKGNGLIRYRWFNGLMRFAGIMV
jgi:hypothetical protein